jgi:secretion/DNA translocation related TadE-like protein
MSRGSNQRGSVSVVAAGLLVVLLVCTIGIADLSRAMRVRAQVRTAADAAALAAAQELAMPNGQDPAEVAAVIASQNGAVLQACICAVGSYEAVVNVERHLSGLWLAPGTFSLSAQSRAVVDLP